MYAAHVLPAAREYGALYRSFRWQIPAFYNIGVDVCDRWAGIDPTRTAIFNLRADGTVEEVSYGALRDASNRLANALAARGIAKLPVTRDIAPTLEFVWSIDGRADGAEDFNAVLARAASEFTPVETTAEDPALMVYTSGTTGPPKGALHAHRVLLGHLPGIEMPHEFLPQPGDRFWTPADWAWAGGLLDALLPALHYGVPVVAQKFEKFDPEGAFALMAKMRVRNAFIPPTALRMMRSAPRPKARLELRSVGSGGEALRAGTYGWGKAPLGIALNEIYGQTECNLLVAPCAAIGISRAGAMGRPVPGHSVAVIRPDR